IAFVFFFSSRRRHTRWPRDWSSDVCSSDLSVPAVYVTPTPSADLSATKTDGSGTYTAGTDVSYTITVNNSGPSDAQSLLLSDARSEERRVGKECRTGVAPEQ